MRALLLLLVACGSQAPVTPVAPVTPIRRPPPGARVLTAERLDDLPADANIRVETEIAAVAPWTSIATGWLDHDFVLDVVTNNLHYTTVLATNVDGALTPVFHAKDLVAGGNLELVIEVEGITDGGKQIAVFGCGIGASRIPSCAQWSVPGVFDLNEAIDVRTPGEGGISVIADGKTERLWFEFP